MLYVSFTRQAADGQVSIGTAELNTKAPTKPEEIKALARAIENRNPEWASTVQILSWNTLNQ